MHRLRRVVSRLTNFPVRRLRTEMSDEFVLKPEEEVDDLPEDLDDLEVDDPNAIVSDGDDTIVPYLQGED